MIEVDIFKFIVNPLHEALKTPELAQQQVLEKLLLGYAKTGCGKII